MPVRPAKELLGLPPLAFFESDLLIFEHLDWIPSSERLFDPASFILTEENRVKAIMGAACETESAAWLAFFLADRFGWQRESFRTLFDALKLYLRSESFDSIRCLGLNDWISGLVEEAGMLVSDHILSFFLEEPPPDTKAFETGLSTRAMTLSDFQAVLELDTALFPPEWQISVRSLAKILQTPGEKRVLVNDGIVLGYTVMSLHGDTAHIDRFALAEAWQGRGVAQAFLAETIEQTTGKGIKRFTVNTQSSNTASQKLYQRLGFRQMEGLVPVYQLGL